MIFNSLDEKLLKKFEVSQSLKANKVLQNDIMIKNAGFKSELAIFPG